MYWGLFTYYVSREWEGGGGSQKVTITDVGGGGVLKGGYRKRFLSFIGPVSYNIWWENRRNGSFGPKNGPNGTNSSFLGLEIRHSGFRGGAEALPVIFWLSYLSKV